MCAGRMHAEEIDTDVDLARLLAVQFPQWTDLPIQPVPMAGTDNALYRLGDDMVARLPRIEWAGGCVDKEQESLPRLAPLLPVAIPVPLGRAYPLRAIRSLVRLPLAGSRLMAGTGFPTSPGSRSVALPNGPSPRDPPS